MKTAKDISFEDFETVIRFLEKNNQDVLQIAGGEPTIHPKFEQLLVTLISKRIKVNLLSNALWDDPKLNELFAQISPVTLGFLLNIDHPKTYSSFEWSIIEKNLTFLSSRSNVTLSFNISEKNPDYGYIFQLVSKYHFKNLRLSYSMPVTFNGRKNAYLPIEDYKSSAKDVMDFTRKAEVLGAKVGMDNAIPVCMFTPKELLELMLKQVIEPNRNFVCYPAIDIGPDLSVWRCFGTSRIFNRKLTDFRSLAEIYEYYQRVSRLYQFKFFPLKECETCEHAKEKRCQGGCIGFAQAKCEEQKCHVSEPADKDILEMKPKLSDKVTLHRYQIPEESLSICFQDGSEIEIPSSAAELITLLEGKITLKEAIADMMQKNMNPSSAEPFDDFLLELSSQEIMPTIRRLLDQGVIAPQ